MERIVHNVLVVPFVTLDVVHAVILYLSKSTTLLEVYVLFGGEPIDSRAVIISDARVGITLLGLFGQEPYGNVPTTLACVPASELEPLLCYQEDLLMPIKEPRDANPRKTIREMRKN